MRSLIIITIAALLLNPAITQAQNKDVKAYCTMYGNTAKQGSHVDLMSEHGFSIINNTGETQTYHIEVDNSIAYGGPWYSPNAHDEYDVTLESGKRIDYGPVYIHKATYFGTKGLYPIQAKTVIRLKGNYLDGCTSNHTLNIF